MIISPSHKFVFVHIPKCAGTSVRTQLIKCDPDHISMGEVGLHADLGKIDFGHIPLHLLEKYFPKEYSYLEDFTSYAIIRDPLERFGSSLRQMLWRYSQRPMTLIPPSELRDLTLKALEDVSKEIDNPSHKFIFFSRQHDFIYNKGDQVVDNVIPIGLVPEFISHISRKTNTPMDERVKSNQNIELRFKKIGKIAYKINDTLRRKLPLDMHAKIKDSVLFLISKNKSAAEASGILNMPEVHDFVNKHYKDDCIIYNNAVDNYDKIKVSLATV